jgi:HAD superfamily hydrolase (TIGR01484 family)
MKIVLCDIDGCLTEGKNIPLVLENLSAIKETLKNKEEQIALCTGRPQPYVELFCQVLDIKLPCICENGSYLYMPKTDTIEVNPIISKKHLEKLYIIKNKIIPLIMKNIPYKFEPCKDYSLSINTTKPINNLFESIKQKIDNKDIEITYSSSAIDISVKGINKGAAMELLRKKINITKFIGIGDSVADISFLEKCDYAFSPDNAHLDVKSISDITSEYSYSKGVLDIVSNIM